MKKFLLLLAIFACSCSDLFAMTGAASSANMSIFSSPGSILKNHKYSPGTKGLHLAAGVENILRRGPGLSSACKRDLCAGFSALTTVLPQIDGKDPRKMALIAAGQKALATRFGIAYDPASPLFHDRLSAVLKDSEEYGHYMALFEEAAQELPEKSWATSSDAASSPLRAIVRMDHITQGHLLNDYDAFVEQTRTQGREVVFSTGSGVVYGWSGDRFRTMFPCGVDAAQVLAWVHQITTDRDAVVASFDIAPGCFGVLGCIDRGGRNPLYMMVVLNEDKTSVVSAYPIFGYFELNGDEGTPGLCNMDVYVGGKYKKLSLTCKVAWSCVDNAIRAALKNDDDAKRIRRQTKDRPVLVDIAPALAAKLGVSDGIWLSVPRELFDVHYARLSGGLVDRA